MITELRLTELLKLTKGAQGESDPELVVTDFSLGQKNTDTD